MALLSGKYSALINITKFLAHPVKITVKLKTPEAPCLHVGIFYTLARNASRLVAATYAINN